MDEVFGSPEGRSGSNNYKRYDAASKRMHEILLEVFRR
jgi:hypothetical protein